MEFLLPATMDAFRFFQRLNDYSSAIQFLVLSKCTDEAFQLARTHGKMELYAEILGADATPEDYKSVALHFDNERNHFLSGKFYYLAGNYPKVIEFCGSHSSEFIHRKRATRLSPLVAVLEFIFSLNFHKILFNSILLFHYCTLSFGYKF